MHAYYPYYSYITLAYYELVLVLSLLDSTSMHTTRVGVVQRSSREYERVLLMYAYYQQQKQEYDAYNTYYQLGVLLLQLVVVLCIRARSRYYAYNKQVLLLQYVGKKIIIKNTLLARVDLQSTLLSRSMHIHSTMHTSQYYSRLVAMHSMQVDIINILCILLVARVSIHVRIYGY